MKTFKLFLSSLFFVAVCSSCEVASLFNPPACEVVNVKKYDAAFPLYARLKLKVKNEGKTTAYQVFAHANFIKDGKVIATKEFDFGELKSLQSIEVENWCTEISSHSQDYDYLDIELNWLDAHDFGYSEDFNE